MFPHYNKENQLSEYICITSFNLGGAEKIVSDHLWANYYSKNPIQYTLILLYNKEKEHSIPNNVKVIRINGNMEFFNLFLSSIDNNKQIVCHLLNELLLSYFFKNNLNVQLVIHNDQQGWPHKPHIFNHKNVQSVVAVCDYVKKQIQNYTDKPIFVLKHKIIKSNYLFNNLKREKYRQEFNFNDSNIVIGMVGRIAWQKNYAKAIETLYYLNTQNNNYKLIIVGGFEESQKNIYIHLISLINFYNLQKNVILTGFREDAQDIMNCFDLALNTSHFEGMSIASEEYIANGLKLISSDMCGQPEIIDKFNQIIFYKKSHLAKDIANIILKENFTRINLTTEDIQNNKEIYWASQKIWNLLPFSSINVDVTQNNNIAFLTSNLNLGGAQQSLVNLLIEMKKNKINTFKNFHLILANQSDDFYLLNKLNKFNINSYLAFDGIDVFDILINIFNYLNKNNISKLIFWNVDSKLKLLISKLQPNIELIDVSPGNYCFDEINSLNNFMLGISYNQNDFFNNISKFVYKYNEQKNMFNIDMENKIVNISNGVNFEKDDLTINDLLVIENIKKNLNKDYINFVVMGRFDPSKFIEEIINAFLSLKEKNTQISLHFIGKPADYNFNYFNKILKEYSFLFNKNNIYFYNKVDCSLNVLPSFDCLIVMGKNQGCPNIVLEAQASKIFVIANDSGGTKEVINQNYLIEENFSLSSLEGAMNDFINEDKKIIQEKIEFNFLKTKEKFSMQKMLQNYLKIL